MNKQKPRQRKDHLITKLLVTAEWQTERQRGTQEGD